MSTQPPPLHFPNETPEYRAARNELLQAEMELRQKMEDVAALRTKLPLGGKIEQDYEFDELTPDGSKKTKLSELFEEGRRPHLFLYSYMFGPDMEKPCPICTSFVDGTNGYAQHITRRINLAFIFKSGIERIRPWAEQRGWSNLRFLSSANTTYHSDYNSEMPDGQQLPIGNVFTKNDDGIFHFWAPELFYIHDKWIDGMPRHMDLMWPVRSFFNMTPDGRGQDDWLPQL